MTPLWVYAAAAEGDPVAQRLGHAVAVGVGPVRAAAGMTEVLVRSEPLCVIAFGVAGAYPGTGLEVGDLCVVSDDQRADEGVQAPDGFMDLERLGLGDDGRVVADANLTRWLAAALAVPAVRGASVACGSGTDALAQAMAQRTGAAVETMEGAAIGTVCRRMGVPWVQLRAISNRTGDRARAGWDLDRALRRLHEAVIRVSTHPDAPWNPP